MWEQGKSARKQENESAGMVTKHHSGTAMFHCAWIVAAACWRRND
jgi:hypothetical protein